MQVLLNQAIFFMVVAKNSHVKLLAHFYTSRKPGDELLIDRGGVWELVVERNHLFNRLTTDSFHARSKVQPLEISPYYLSLIAVGCIKRMTFFMPDTSGRSGEPLREWLGRAVDVLCLEKAYRELRCLNGCWEQQFL